MSSHFDIGNMNIHPWMDLSYFFSISCRPRDGALWWVFPRSFEIRLRAGESHINVSAELNKRTTARGRRCHCPYNSDVNGVVCCEQLRWEPLIRRRVRLLPNTKLLANNTRSMTIIYRHAGFIRPPLGSSIDAGRHAQQEDAALPHQHTPPVSCHVRWWMKAGGDSDFFGKFHLQIANPAVYWLNLAMWSLAVS